MLQVVAHPHTSLGLEPLVHKKPKSTCISTSAAHGSLLNTLGSSSQFPWEKLLDPAGNFEDHSFLMKTRRAIINSVFPPQKLQLLEDFLHKPKHSLLNSQEQRGLPNFRVYDMKSLLGYSFATSDVLEKYQQKLATTCSNVLFVQPTLYRILEESRSPPTDLCEKEFHKYEFVFWPKSKLFYLDTWGEY